MNLDKQVCYFLRENLKTFLKAHKLTTVHFLKIIIDNIQKVISKGSLNARTLILEVYMKISSSSLFKQG
jgi:hypothetical protein